MRYISTARVLRAHAYAVHTAGGTLGVRDEGLLLSALAAPKQAVAYGETRIAVVAAVLAYALAKNHAFLDGNKRIAFFAMDMFLRRNGYRVCFAPQQWADIMVAVAAGAVSRETLAAEIQAILPQRRSNPDEVATAIQQHPRFSDRKLAAMLGCSSATVNRARARMGIKSGHTLPWLWCTE